MDTAGLGRASRRRGRYGEPLRASSPWPAPRRAFRHCRQ